MKKAMIFSLFLMIFGIFCLSPKIGTAEEQVIGYCPNRVAHASAVYNGKEYKFCCEGCKEKFLRNPDKYLN